MLLCSVFYCSVASLLSITDLHISVEGKEIVRGLQLEMQEGEVHAIMGPNGSGKSTLVNALMGHPKYEITAGAVQFRGKDLLSLEPHERSQLGLFLAFQYPKEIAGVSLRSFLLAAHRAQVGSAESGQQRLSPLQFEKVLKRKMEELHMDTAFADRSLNQGFSGGEKKKAEILQMAILQPRLALLDETDSGLDVDALKIVAEGVNALRAGSDQRVAISDKESSATGYLLPAHCSFLIVTHYARILDYITPDHVHVMVAGRIVASGTADFARVLEKEGYGKYGVREEKTAIRLEVEGS